MSEQSRLKLLGRVANALLGLESLSDGKTAKVDPNRVHGGESTGGLQVLRDKSPYEFMASELESWCDKAEDRAKAERRRVAGPMTKLEENYWFIEEWEGKDYHVVAERTGMDPQDVWLKRQRLGVDPKTGRPLEQAA